MRAPMLVAVVVAFHAMAVGAVLFIQGCGTTRTAQIEPPPAPVMPPRQETAATTPSVMPRPVLQPPVAVEHAPSVVEPGAGTTYTIQSGDSLSKIAQRFGVSSREIAELNNIKDPNKIRIGQKLLLPGYAHEQTPAKKSSASKKSESQAKASAQEGDYVVKAGDSLSKIAANQGTTVKALREVNSLKSDTIRIGQKLIIPGAKAAKPVEVAAAEPAPASAEAAPAPVEEPAPAADATSAMVTEAPAAAPAAAAADAPFEYTVKPDESLDDIARSFAVLKQDIMDLNGITDPATIQPGQKLKIPFTSP